MQKIASHLYRPAPRGELIAAMRTSFSALWPGLDLDQGLLTDRDQRPADAADREDRTSAAASSMPGRVLGQRDYRGGRQGGGWGAAVGFDGEAEGGHAGGGAVDHLGDVAGGEAD